MTLHNDLIPRGVRRAGVWAVLLLTVLCTASAEAAKIEMTDQRITDAVENELRFDPGVASNLVDIRTEAGIVTLEGSVDNILAKERAVKIAETVKGVRAVVNTIEVSPSWKISDKDLKAEVANALLLDPATDSYQISVTVKDGMVTLAGTADSWQEKDLAEKVAGGVKGVRGITNNIAVNYKTVRADSEIKTEIREALRWNRLVDDYLINVEVQNGEVTLTGTVGSAAEKSTARITAWVAGVNSVDASGLVARDWFRDDARRKRKYAAKSDAEIDKAVKDALFYDPRVKSFSVSPSSLAGVVTLRGTVDNLKAKRAAAQDARNTVGVVRVDNRLKVRWPSAALPDEKLEKSVRSALAWDPIVESYEIRVDVRGRVAFLTGTVDSFFERGQAEEVASRVNGIIDVRNNLSVLRPRPLAYDPYVYHWYPYDYEWYALPQAYTFKTDKQIKDDIESQLFWSPFVDGDEIEVDVDNGVATLSGNVETWGERKAAEENAYEGGATWVDNDIDVS